MELSHVLRARGSQRGSIERQPPRQFGCLKYFGLRKELLQDEIMEPLTTSKPQTLERTFSNDVTIKESEQA